MIKNRHLRPICPEGSRESQSRRNGFSLVEVTIAIGLFAFVMVGILGLFPTATKMRADSALETRAVMIAQQLFSYVESADVTNLSGSPQFSVTKVAVRDGPAFDVKNTRTNLNLLNPGGVVLGYQNRSSMPYYFFGTTNAAAWTNMPSAVDGSTTTTADNEITTLARVFAEPTVGGCHRYRVTVEVRSPAIAPLLINDGTPGGRTNPGVSIVRLVKFF
jgi:type II secretory pathway pseudopilin PulG